MSGDGVEIMQGMVTEVTVDGIEIIPIPTNFISVPM